MIREKIKDFRAKHALTQYVEISGEESTRRVYHHDRAEVTYCPYFRRMAFRRYHFPNRGPENRTRLLHSIEVSTMASGMARRLLVDVDLTEAIALGHDIAQPPLGYPVEGLLRDFVGDGQYNHAKLSSRILLWNSLKDEGTKQFEELESRGCYSIVEINGGGKKIATITDEAIDGIMKHTPPYVEGRPSIVADPPLTIEGQLVRVADTLSYISQEIDEALRINKSFVEKLQSYAGCDTFTLHTDSKDIVMTREDLLAPPFPRSTNYGENFLNWIFSPAFGPHVTSMIRRFEEVAKAQLLTKQCDRKPSHYCERSRLPILPFDPTLQFLIDFLWKDFIIDTVNQEPVIVSVVENNRSKICKLLDLLYKYIDDYRDNELETRRHELRTYELSLKEGTELFTRVLIANYISCLTDEGVDIALSQLEEISRRSAV